MDTIYNYLLNVPQAHVIIAMVFVALWFLVGMFRRAW